MAEPADRIDLKILSPSTEVDGDINLPDLPTATTVTELRQLLQNAIATKPTTERMRLIYRGRVVASDDDSLRDVFGQDAINSSKEQSLHLVLRELNPPAASASPAPRSSTAPPNPFRAAPSPPQTNPFRPVQQSRPSSLPQLPQPPQHPHVHPHPHHHHHHHPHAHGPPLAQLPGGGMPLPPELQRQIAHAQQALANNMANLSANGAIPGHPQSRGGTPGPAGADGTTPAVRPTAVTQPPTIHGGQSRTVRHEAVGPNGERWTVINTNITIPGQVVNQQVPILPRPFPHPPGHAARILRPDADADAIDNLLSRIRAGMQAARQEMDNVRTLIRGPDGLPTGQAATAGLANVGNELFILASPQGPVGILYDQRGVYTTAPMVNTLPFQTFTQHFSTNRQLVAALGQQLAQNPGPIQLTANQPPQNQQPQANAPDPAAANQNQDQNQPQNRNPQENDRFVAIAGHMWFIFKIACFIYIFAGGGGWYRPMMMALVAGIAYLAQLGLFEPQMQRIRQHFEALLPIPQPVARGANANGNQNPPPNGQPPAPANPNPTPQETAQRLVRQHQENRFTWVRDRMRTTERAVALFVASLWPGLGERMVQAQEERERAERVAEEEERERVRAEEERVEEERRKAAEGEEGVGEGKMDIGVGGGGGGGADEQGEGSQRVEGKGKERAVVEGEGAASSS
ncbi:hypothetical protein P154DRAFT_502955 [Amniculicola lignicola CBS 123094]|uniref:Ubiquitin-like domain-containing protein n=1 Tax=Amniculicola lignicola CBS 123094 TaxID=1392246 RepID=A0A6A5VVD0_9PLEO|nr:hypothetical protein P154DRAFT_502955 [Amniculicola lignicola CBS 123094]